MLYIGDYFVSHSQDPYELISLKWTVIRVLNVSGLAQGPTSQAPLCQAKTWVSRCHWVVVGNHGFCCSHSSSRATSRTSHL